MTRVYTSLDAPALDALEREGRFAPRTGFAATEALLDLVPERDEEEGEHLATQLAAATSSTPRIVVAALEVASPSVTVPANAPVGAVELTGEVLVRDVVCYLVGDPGETVGDDADVELSWYDAGERAAVRALL